ncbi:hypothetical protein M8C21_033110, partial [Ambrosia artemisiifolia]
KRKGYVAVLKALSLGNSLSTRNSKRYYEFQQAAMVKSLDTLLLRSSARASRLINDSLDLFRPFPTNFSLIHIVPYFKIRKNDLATITASSTILTQGFAISGLLNEIHKPTIYSTCSTIGVVNNARKYGDIELCGSSFSKSNNFLNDLFSFGEIQYKNERNQIFQKTSFFLIRIITRPNLFNNWISGVIEQYGLMKHGDHIGVVIQRKLGPLLLGSYSQFICILEQRKICWEQIPQLWRL